MTKQVGGGNAPICPSCEKNDMVRRMWRGREKHWYCDRCFKVTSTKKKEATLKQRLLHRLPEPDTFAYSEIFPNRRARRAQKGR
jgi:hypothetical protein